MTIFFLVVLGSLGGAVAFQGFYNYGRRQERGESGLEFFALGILGLAMFGSAMILGCQLS